MLNDFEIMCERLMKCNRCAVHNEITCAMKNVKEYVGADKNKLLNLKAEAQGGDAMPFWSLTFSMAALAISTITLICTASGIIGSENRILFWTAIVTIIIIPAASWLAIKPFIFVKKYNSVYKWRKYILVAIEELERTEFRVQK